MKKFSKKLLVIMMALVMVMSMGVSVFAEGEEVELTITSEGMFKPTAAKLVGTGEDTNLVLTYASASYDKLYLGTAHEAVLTADPAKTIAKSAEDTYTLPIGTTTGEFAVAAHSVKNEGWYDRTFTLDVEAKTLKTVTASTPIVPDDFAEDWDEEVSVESSLGMLQIESTKVIVNEDGTVDVKMLAGNPSREFPKIALLSQDASVEEKEANAIVGVKTGDANNNYVYEFTVPAEKLADPIDYTTYQLRNGTEEWHNWSSQHTLTINSSTVVNELISQIQVQKNNEHTAEFIVLAKKCWDKLSDEDQLKDDGYFSDDTGDASKDDPLNTAPDKTKELLVVSFGTSFNESRAEDIGGIEKALAAANPDWAVRRAFTAQIIINHVEARDGEKIDNMEQALKRAVDSGVKELIVQPTHLMHGAEYDELMEALAEVTDKFDSVQVAEPLLGPVGADEAEVNSDKEAAAKAAVEEAVKVSDYDTLEAMDADKAAIVFMGHGTSHDAAITYAQMQTQMQTLGYKNVFVGTVEGKPESTSLPEVKKAVEAAGYTKVILRPLMVVAGDHANNDMADEEEGSGSWFDGFANGGEFEVEGADKPVDIGEGFGKDNVKTQIEGLGRIAAIQKMYVDHTAAALQSAADKPAAADEAAKAAEEAKKIDTSVYSEENAKAIADAIAELEKVAADKLSTADQINAAKKALEDAIKKADDDKAADDAAKEKAEIAKVKAGKIKSFKAKAGKKKVTFTWKKNTTFAGYQLKYKVGKKAKTLNIKSAKTVKKIVKKLKKGAKVTAQIRGYKKIAGKTYYGKWAKSKAVKVK